MIRRGNQVEDGAKVGRSGVDMLQQQREERDVAFVANKLGFICPGGRVNLGK